MSSIIIDLHCHPSLKKYNNAVIKDLWMEFKNEHRNELFDDDLKEILISCSLKKEIDDFATYSQSNLEACYNGRNRVLFATIYPVERPFVRPDRPFDHPDILPKQKKKLVKLFYRKKGKEADYEIERKLIQAITGFSKEKAEQYINEIKEPETVIDYFKDYIGEYHILKDAQNTSKKIENVSAPITFKIINEYADIVELGTHEIAAIVNVEGAHSLGVYQAKDLLEVSSIDQLSATKKKALKDVLFERVAILKGQKEYQFNGGSHTMEHTPFYLTLSHHFNNLISGHAQSFKGPRNKRKPGFNQIFNQKNGQNAGLTQTGKDLINALLSRENGRRILIDTKHMSIETRSEFHEIALAQKAPIICSHTAVNGLKDFEEAKTNRANTKRDFNSYISRMDINLTDKDIEDIYDSDGIIGVCMHDGRMPGGLFKNAIREAQGFDDESKIARVNRLYAQIFLMNVFHIVRVNKRRIKERNEAGENIDPKTAWKTVCLGTDYDGIIDPFNHLTSAKELIDFKSVCITALKNRNSEIEELKKYGKIRLIDNKSTQPYKRRIFDELMMGMKPRTLMDKVFATNLDDFLKKYFTEAYLRNGE